MSKAIAMLSLGAVQLFITYFVMTIGWGLEVRNWSALILGLFATNEETASPS
jgi:hypothetical protein